MARAGFLVGDQRRQLEQGFQHVHAQHAVLPEECIRQLVGSRHRAGVRCGEVLSDLRAPELVDNHRLAGGKRPARRVREVIRVADGFHEEQNRAGMRIVDEAVGDLADTEVASLPTETAWKTGAAPETARQEPPIMLPDCETIASGPG